MQTQDDEAEFVQKGRRRGVLIGLGVAAVAVLIAGGVVLTAHDDATEPLTDQPPVATDSAQNPLDQTAEDVAQGFVEAYGAFDVDRASTYLADDADITGLIDWFTTEDVQGTRDELRLLLSLLEAHSYQQIRDSCDELRSSPTGTSVRCTFDFHSLRSDELGLGPFSGNSLVLTVRDGQIVHTSYHFDDEQFSDQVWNPFAVWMLVKHAQDYHIFSSGAANGARLTEESIPLWEQYTREYVAAMAAGS